MYRQYLTPTERRKRETERQRKAILSDRPDCFPFNHPMMDAYFKTLEEKRNLKKN